MNAMNRVVFYPEKLKVKKSVAAVHLDVTYLDVYFPSICCVFVCVYTHSCQSSDPTVHLQEGITEEHKFIRVESHALRLNVRPEQTMQFYFHQLRSKC